MGGSGHCRLCLSTDRRLSAVEDARWAYRAVTDTTETSSGVCVCWECRAVLLKLTRLKRQAERARCLLQACWDQGTDIDLKLEKSFSRLSSVTKFSYDADLTFDYETPSFVSPPTAPDDVLDSKQIIPKQEPEESNELDTEIWADPPEYADADGRIDETRLSEVTDESKGEPKRKGKKPRPLPKPRFKTSDKFEIFTATAEDLFNYRQRALAHMPSFAYSCHTCVMGFRVEDKFNKHNIKYHSQTSSPHVCDVCSSRFRSERALRRHRGAHYRMYRCRRPGCGFTHPRRRNLLGHAASHEPKDCGAADRTLQCDLCAKRFSTATGLAVHRAAHTSDQTYACDICKKTFKTRSHIHRHMRHHTLKAMCDVCGKRLPNQRMLNVHALAHLDSSHRPYECDTCHKRYNDKYKLLVHTRTHTGERPFPCDICARKYISKEQLTQHKKKHHSEAGVVKQEFKPRTKSFFRNERVFPFTQQKRLAVKREKNSDASVTGSFQCNICGKRLSTYQNLQSHFGVHSDERPFKCDECDRTFKYKPQLYAHKLRHRGDKPHQCTICGSRFVFKTILNAHLKVHSDEKPYKCDECDVTFKHNSGLWTHKLIHKGERPHQCTICGARFILKGNLTGHMKTHTNEKPFECNLCGRKFPWRRNLRNHFKTHSKEQRVLDHQP